MVEYLNLIVSETDNVFDELIKNKANEETKNAITQNAHPHLQKIAKILDAAKKAKDAKNDNVDFTDIGIGENDKFKISIDTKTDPTKPKLIIKDTQTTQGTDTLILDGTTLKYEKNKTKNVYIPILLDFKTDDATQKVTEAITPKKAEADVANAKALLREAINGVLEEGIITELKTYDNSQESNAKTKIKEILTKAKDEKLDFLTGKGIDSGDLALDEGHAKIILKRKSTNNIELDIIYDHDGNVLEEGSESVNKFVLNGEELTYTEASEEGDKLKDLANVDDIKTKIEGALNKEGGKLKFTTDEIAKAKAKADLYQTLVTNLPKVLTKDKIDNLIKAGTTGIENTELKAIVDEAKKLDTDVSENISLGDNKNITLTLKADGTKIEISASNGKKDTITLSGNKFKLTTDNKFNYSVLEELEEIKNTLGQEPFKKAIEAARNKIPKEKGQVLTQDEVNKRKAFLDAVYKNDDDNALKTILAAISNQDLTTANTDEAILGKIGEDGKTKIKDILTKAKDVVEYVKSLALTATIGGATVKLEILDNNTPALTIEKDGKKDTFKLSGDNNGQLAYESAKTPTKDSVLHLLSNFDPANLNATLSVFIAKNGGEITAKEITAGNIDRIEDTADDKERDLKVAQATLAAINAGEKATAEKIKALEEKVKTLEKAKEDATKAKTEAEKIVTDAGEKATQEQKAAAQKAVEAEVEAGIAAAEADAELKIAKEAQTKAKAEDVTTPEKIAKAKEKITKDIQAKSKQVDVLNDALAETNVNTVKANDALKEKQTALTEAQDTYDKAPAEQKAEKLKELNEAKKEVAEAKEEVGEANADRAKRATRKLDNTNKSIAESLGDISA
ncbi:hypothetical protein, partial [Campylobacter pinnipediorum]|uniref:hypothetical protein n=1 Tax=Campylobacter pinnipediorum TaxID=1965231 RepID=UPI001C5A9347